MSLYRGRRVLVTGGGGFLGSYVVRELVKEGATVRIASRNPRPVDERGIEVLAADLRLPEGSQAAVEGVEFVFHLAAVGWGLGENARRQPELLTQNLLMNTVLLDAAYRAGVERYLLTSSSSVYPGHLSMLDEDAPWDSPPHSSEEGFGWAKRMAEIQARMYATGYGMKIAVVRPTNPYGPGDNFDPTSSHVIPALIHKVLVGGNPVIVWGSGKAVRSFVHARDVARGMLLALERYAVCDPVNLASEETASVGDLVRLIVELSGRRDARIEYDSSKPEGHPCKIPPVKKAEKKFGFRAECRLREGLEETILWYRERSLAGEALGGNRA